MFYEFQEKYKQEQYKKMLNNIAKLSKLFSDDDHPYLAYRVHENCFCRYFDAENLSRKDVSVDAKIGDLGIGLKTWTGQDDQKIAEFGKLRPQYAHLSGIELVKKIAEYRNERIRFTKNTYGINKLVYHVAKRVKNGIEIIETPFELIDVENIKLIKNNRSGDNNTYFTDGKNKYHFSISKNTLYMIFDTSNVIDHIDTEIIEDPFITLEKLFDGKLNEKDMFSFAFTTQSDNYDILRGNQICLKLYGYKNEKKVVFEKSGINIWNAGGRKRNPNEIYIPYPKEDRVRNELFFPDRDTPFKLVLPNGNELSAKICQENGKAIMSNPNSDLGKWLLRDVLGVKEFEIVTYDKLQLYGVDSVVITKLSDLLYKIDFAPLGSYEKYYLNKKEVED